MLADILTYDKSTLKLIPLPYSLEVKQSNVGNYRDKRETGSQEACFSQVLVMVMKTEYKLLVLVQISILATSFTL